MSDVAYKPIDGFPAYRVGDDGSVWSLFVPGWHKAVGTQWRRLKPSSPCGVGLHMAVTIRSEPCGKPIRRYVHQLVLEAFVGPRPSGMEGAHDDGDPTNNRLGNLFWKTKQANQADRVRHGTDLRGEQHPMVKLSEKDVLEIVASRVSGVVARLVAERKGICESTVSAIMRGRIWSHVTGLPKRERGRQIASRSVEEDPEVAASPG